MKSVIGIVLASLALTGCAQATPSQSTAAASTSTTTASTTTTTTTTPAASAGDVAACKAYQRVEQTANKMITTMATNPQAHYVIADFFKKWADDLERGTVAATDAKLTESLAGTVAGLKSVQATAAASDGTKQLDLRPDMQVVDDSSTNVAAFCLDADPGVNYVAIAYRG